MGFIAGSVFDLMDQSCLPPSSFIYSLALPVPLFPFTSENKYQVRPTDLLPSSNIFTNHLLQNPLKFLSLVYFCLVLSLSRNPRFKFTFLDGSQHLSFFAQSFFRVFLSALSKTGPQFNCTASSRRLIFF